MVDSDGTTGGCRVIACGAWGIARRVIIHTQITTVTTANLGSIASTGVSAVDLVDFVGVWRCRIACITLCLVLRAGEDILALLSYCLAKIVGVRAINIWLLGKQSPCWGIIDVTAKI